VDLKVRFYGESHETLITPLKNLASVMQLEQKYEEALIFYENAQQLLDQHIEKGKPDYKVKSWKKTLKDILYFQFVIFEAQKT
jgi:hypothetical protein